MRTFFTWTLVTLLAGTVLVGGDFACAQGSSGPVGFFESHGDVGTVLHAGAVDYDSSKQTYTISGSGENMWLTADAFQFAWKKMSGDVTLTADIAFLTKTGNEHKKAVLMLRQNFDADSIYADVALHASGLTSLQFRDEKGAVTREIQSNLSAPKRLRIVKRGEYVYMSLSMEGVEPHVAGGWLRIPLRGEFYVGLGVCSHDKDVVEKAVFSNVELTQLGPAAGQPALYSSLETVEIDSMDRRVAYLAQGRFEAPNWTRDGKAFFFNRDGHIERLPVDGGAPVKLDTGLATRCNNDHGISPDATQLAISDNSQEDHNSLVYIVPIAGGAPRRITQKSPSYWHGWSPDGKTLAFVGQRDGEFDIYTIPAAGGEETRLTTAKGLDDGPEYTPDGKYIYFNSERTGHMQIWRMKPDGSEQEQVFSDEFNNWFPHISPDGKWMVFLTYDASVTGHPENKDVMLRLMSLADNKITVLAKLFGGQGTINVPSWSPDSARVAFVSYQLIPPEDSAGAK
jgi:TolB protein